MTRDIALKAPAKINLGFSILRKLPNGYHEVKTIYSQISLFDELKIKQIDKDKIEVLCDDKNIPTNEKNFVYQAVDLVKKQTKTKKGIRVFIKKRIPVGSGLGGGSSDAAQTLIGLNKIWQLGLSQVQLVDLAKIIGSDAAYQLAGGVQMEIQGGKKAGNFFSLGKLPECFILLCIPRIMIKSKTAYCQVEYDKIGENNLVSLIKALKNKNLSKIAKNLHNDFELWTFKKYPVIRKVKMSMLENGALGSLMSGKGSAVFGIFDNKDRVQKALNLLKKDYPKTFLVEQYYQKRRIYD